MVQKGLTEAAVKAEDTLMKTRRINPNVANH